MATNKVLLTKAASNSKTLQQIADDVVAKVAGSSLVKILVSQDTIIFDTDNSRTQAQLKTGIDDLNHGKTYLDHENFKFLGTRSTVVPGVGSSHYWHLDAITRLNYQAAKAAGNVTTYSTSNEGDEVDIYILDSGVRGASRPTGIDVGLHPEFYNPDNNTNLNGTSEQADYRVYELPSALYTSPATGGSNEPQSTGSNSSDGHGTYAAICAAGVRAGVANKARIYSVRISDDTGVMSYSSIRTAYDAVYNHNDPTHANYKGNTLDGNTRPRPSIVNCSFGSTLPNPLSPWVDRNERYVGQNYTFNVTATGNSNYTISGTDANGAVSGDDPNIFCKKGDTLTFTMNASGHPFHIQTGGASYNNSLAAGGVSGAGNAASGDVVFDTAHGCVGKASGSFVYVCQNHASMLGNIYVEQSPTTNNGTNELLDDGEHMLGMLKNVTVCRSAGNGLDFELNDVPTDYGPVNTKVVYGSRSTGQDSKLDAEITLTDNYSRRGEQVGYGEEDTSDVITVGALKIGSSNKLEFADFTNYGEAVTAYAPGQGIYLPSYDWASGTVTNVDYSNGNHITISGTSFSAPIVAGMSAIFRQIHDGAAEGKVCAKWAAERRYQFADLDDSTDIASTPVGGWLNNTVVSDGAATTNFFTDHNTETHYRFKTNAGTNNIVMQLTTGEYNIIGPSVDDIFEFEFPRVEDSPNAPDVNSLMRAQMKKDTFNLGERRDYKFTVSNPGGGNKLTWDRMQNGVPNGNPQAGIPLELDNGVVYRFYQTDPSNLTHPIDISDTSDGTHAGGKSFVDYVDQVIGKGAHGYRMNLKYYVDQGGLTQVDKTTYDNLAGSGPECFIEWINPMGNTHPDVDSSVYPTDWHYYCVNHPGMGSGIIQSTSNSGFGNTTECTIGGIDIQEFCSKWRKVTAVSSIDKTITFQADTTATHTEEGGGGGFNNCLAGAEYATGDKPRWPMRFTKITGTFYENDAFWNWINNHSNVVNGNSYAGGAFTAGEYWARLEVEEGVSDGKPVQYFPVPKSRFTHQSISSEWENTHAYPDNTLYNAGSRWGRGKYDNVQHKFVPVPEEFSRDHIYDMIPVFHPYIDLVASWTTPSGLIGTLTNGTSVNIDLSVSAITTFANETIGSGHTPEYELVSGGGRAPFTYSSGTGKYTIDGTGLALDQTTGALQGTCTNPNNDTTYTLQVRDKVSDQAIDYSFTLVGTASGSSTVTITGSPSNATGDGSYPVDSGTVTYTCSATDSLGTALEYQWKYAINSTQANLGNWTNVPTTGSFAGAGGVNTDTLTIPDNLLLDGYLFSCVVNSSTAASSEQTGSASLSITVTVSCTAWWSGQTSLYAATECAGTSGTCTQAEVEIQAVSSDGATLNLAPGYNSTLTGNETDIVSRIVDGNNFCLEALGGNGTNGHPLYRVKLGYGSITFNDNNQTIKITATHPTLGTSATATSVGGPFTINPNYNESPPSPTTASVQSGNAHSFTVSYGHSSANFGGAAATIIWRYKLDGGAGWVTVDGTESWFSSRDDSTTNSSTLTIAPTTTFDNSIWQAAAYVDTASSGVTDTKDIAKYSTVYSNQVTLTVLAAPTINLQAPSGVTPDNSISVTKGTLSTSEHLLTIVSDGLPDPAIHGADFVAPNDLRVVERTHSIIYRGGTNTPSLTPWTNNALGVFANGVSVRYPSAGTDKLPNGVESPPATLQFNEVHFASLYNADQASGFCETTGEYHYQTSAFMEAWAGDGWQGVAGSNGYYKNSNFNGNAFQHPDGHSKIVGIAYDGYPIYGPFGYTTYNDNTSGVKRVTSSFALKANDNHRPTNWKFTDEVTFTDSTPNATLVNGSFIEDYQYNPGSGDLDQSNGRYCVTPEYPNGTYAYFMPQDANSVPQFPYIVGTALRQAYYLPGTNASDPGGTNTQGPGSGGFDITSIFCKGMTMVAETGGDNTREITGDTASMQFGSAPYTYIWQKSSDNGTTWVDISAADAGFFNYNSDTLTVYDKNAGIDDLLVRLKVTNSLSVYKVSDAVPIQYIGSTLSISAQPQPASIISGQSNTFTVTAASTDDVTLEYQWQESQDSGTSWTDLAGETAASMTRSGIQTAVGANGYEYRVKITSTSATNSPLYSSSALLTVTQGSINIDSQPSSITKDEGTSHSFDVSVTTNSGLAVIYQWQQWDGSAWQNVGSNQNTLDLTALDYATYNGAQYQVVCTIPGLGSLTSNTATLTIERTISIDTDPVDVTVYATQNATFSVVASVSSGTATYQWEESQDGGTTWSDLAGATTASYTVTSAATSQDGYKYRVKVDVAGSGGSITSNSATLTVAVQPTLIITGQPSDASVYQPDTHSFNVTASASDGSSLTWQWQKSDDNGTSWQDVAGATTNGYTTPATSTATDNGDQYRVVVSHPAATNSPLTSNAAVLTVVTPVIQVSTQPVSVSTTAGVPTNFTVAANVTSGKQIDYQWQESGDNGTTWTDITGAIADNISITGNATNNNYRYRCLFDSLGAAQVTSQSATLTLTFIQQPTLQTSHIDSSTSKTFVRQPKIQGSLFISYLGNGHYASFWKITRNSDNVVVYDTSTDLSADGDQTNKVELTTPVLDWNTSYTITVKYKDAAGYISAESAATSFTTPVADQPTFNLPIPTSLRPTITLNTPSYDTVNYNHTSTDWQIADDAAFSNVIYESLGDVDNKTELEVPSNVVLQSSTNYYVRTRLNVT